MQLTSSNYSSHVLDGSPMSLEAIERVSRHGVKISLSQEVEWRVEQSRATLDQMISENRVIYGVNTGVGGFVNVLLPTEEAEQLQNNLLHAVATNVGPPLSPQEVRATILARIVSLARGNSAIRPENLRKLVDLYNSGVIPVVPSLGSLGTSGDLAQLAAIGLVATGQWKACYEGREMSGAQALSAAGLVPMNLTYKEGLALVNGTSAMAGVGALVIQRALRLLDTYLSISALSFEALAAKRKPLDPVVHELKPHIGQRIVAKRLYDSLAGSTMIQDDHEVELCLTSEIAGRLTPRSKQIEDAYSLRCTPQILGPVYDAIQSAASHVENEINSSNDNPLIVPDREEVYHNGHFHGQYVALAMDLLNISTVTLCNLSDRRTDRLLKVQCSNGLPPFLCNEDPGLRLGLMGGQFMATSLTAEVRSLATPISIQSLPSTGDFQDIVSLGFVSTRRAIEILRKVEYVTCFELICACQAADIRGADKLSQSGRMLYERVRSIVPYLDHDVVLTDYLESVRDKLFS